MFRVLSKGRGGEVRAAAGVWYISRGARAVQGRPCRWEAWLRLACCARRRVLTAQKGWMIPSHYGACARPASAARDGGCSGIRGCSRGAVARAPLLEARRNESPIAQACLKPARGHRRRTGAAIRCGRGVIFWWDAISILAHALAADAPAACSRLRACPRAARARAGARWGAWGAV